jgi:hypothetical protein
LYIADTLSVNFWLTAGGIHDQSSTADTVNPTKEIDMTILLSTIALVIAAVGIGFAMAPRAQIVTSTTIDATPAQVWAVLGKPQSYKDWNPFLVRMEGQMIEGARLTNTMRPSGSGKEMTFRPVVLKVVPDKELRWLGRFLLPRIFDGEHYFLLQDREGRTHLTHGEAFRGIGLWFMDVEQLRRDFEAMNAALKLRVEANI